MISKKCSCNLHFLHISRNVPTKLSVKFKTAYKLEYGLLTLYKSQYSWLNDFAPIFESQFLKFERYLT